MSLDARMQAIWYGRRGVSWLLLSPLSWLFYLIVAIRRWAFRVGVLPSVKVAQPVVVVGNLSVGGTGKTPLVIWLANALARQDVKVAVITRGYGGTAASWPQSVLADSDPAEVGDEAVLIAQQTAATVIAGPDRVAAANRAIAAGAQVIISDDGLQHYRLRRDCELVVIDGTRLLGNGSLLPAGPLREPASRLAQVGLVLLNRRNESGPAVPDALGAPCIQYRVMPIRLRSLASDEQRSLDTLKGQQVHVVTGIGNPHAFLEALRQRGINVSARVLPDHAKFQAADLEFGDALPVLMTEKDAVKCRAFARVRSGRRFWAVNAEVVLDEAAAATLLATVKQAMAQHASH